MYYEFPPGLPPQHPQQPTNQQQSLPQMSNVIHLNGVSPRGLIISTNQYTSPQRRFLSESELVRQGGNELSYTRINNTVDNIRELAESPQRGVYLWKDSSPGFANGGNNAVLIGNHHQSQFIPNQHPVIIRTQGNFGTPSQVEYQQSQYDIHHHRSNPTSPTIAPQQQQIQATPPYILRYGSSINSSNQPNQNQANTSSVITGTTNISNCVYQPALRGGVPVLPSNTQSSPQIKRKQTPTRPISFVRALEMTDSMEMQSVEQQQPNRNNNMNNSGIVAVNGSNVANPTNISNNQINQQHSSTSASDRTSVYDMNYEISV